MARPVKRRLPGTDRVSYKCLVTGCSGRRGKDEIFCPHHWFSLPGPLREDIWAAHAQGDREESLNLIKEACQWLQEHE